MDARKARLCPVPFRHIHSDTVAFVVRITTSGYYVLEQATTMQAAMIAAKKRLSGGSCCVRRREDGRRYTVAELESFGWLSPEEQATADWEHANL